MGSVDEVKSCKSEKPSSPAPAPADQANAHAYPPEWAAMQAYYGAGVALPPYYNAAVASGHAPHPYMWIPPQHMMPPFGPPYAAMYPHGGVYTHPVIPLAETPAEAPAKSSVDTGRSSKKKSKGYDGLAISIGNGTAESKKQASDHDLSQSTETEVSSDGSDGNMKTMDQTAKKRGIEGTPITGKEGKIVSRPTIGNDISSSSVTKKKAEAVFSPSLGAALELTIPSSMNTKTSSAGAPQASAPLLSDGWGQNERDLKRERRKQSNRESARRSRLRKHESYQAKAEELAVKVEALKAENLTLKSEMNQLAESSKKLKLENAMLMEKLKLARLGQTEVMAKAKSKRSQPLSTENLLSRVNNSSSVHMNYEDEEKMYETNSKSNTKLRQLMDAKPMASTVTAG